MNHFDDIKSKAYRILALREHSTLQLRQKLLRKACDEDLVESVLDQLERENALNNARFGEMLVRTRYENGYGPAKIAFELKQAGVSSDTIAMLLDDNVYDWCEAASKLWQKKFGEQAKDLQAKAKQCRYLSNRGFSSDHIYRVVGDV